MIRLLRGIFLTFRFPVEYKKWKRIQEENFNDQKTTDKNRDKRVKKRFIILFFIKRNGFQFSNTATLVNSITQPV